MENKLYLIFIGAVTIFLVATIYAIFNSFASTDGKIEAGTKGIDFKTGQEALNFLDRIIKEKYKFYMYTELYPIYLNNKIPDKSTILKTKEKIYASVVGSLSFSVKKEILNFFTEKGIEIYTNEKILILINETDFSASNLAENFKDLKPYQVDTVMP